MNQPWTEIGGENTSFAPTHWSILVRARDQKEARQNWDALIRLYWKPVYSFVRRKWAKSNEDAKDCTQSFFALMMTRSWLDKVGSEKGRFRTYLRRCLENYLRDCHDKEVSLKRGGGENPLSLDFIAANQELAVVHADDRTPEEQFDRDWAKTAMEAAIVRLRESYEKEGRSQYWSAFEAYDVNSENRPSYTELANRLGLKESDVMNYLTHVRRRLREFIEDMIRQTTCTEEDAKDEIAALFGW